MCPSDKPGTEYRSAHVWLRHLQTDRRLPAGSLSRPLILICIQAQRLYWWDRQGPPIVYVVSTAARGCGNQANSEQTPIGLHRVAQCIGQGYPCGTVFRGRKAIASPGFDVAASTPKIETSIPEVGISIQELNAVGLESRTSRLMKDVLSQKTEEVDPREVPVVDPITSRILWLEGLEPGINQGEGCDTYRRYIYIHGTVDEASVGGPPSSHGCIRMRNDDVIDLFARTPVHTPVLILATCAIVPKDR